MGAIKCSSFSITTCAFLCVSYVTKGPDSCENCKLHIYSALLHCIHHLAPPELMTGSIGLQSTELWGLLETSKSTTKTEQLLIGGDLKHPCLCRSLFCWISQAKQPWVVQLAQALASKGPLCPCTWKGFN